MRKAGYPIRAVSRLTGLSIDTLRAWERRYEAIKPSRAGRGRFYSEEDIQRLKLLKGAIEGGHSIGQIANLTNEELIAMASQMESLGVRRQEMASIAKNEERADLKPVLTAIEKFDYVVADRELNRLAAILSTHELIYQVVIPLMKEVGDRWYKGSFSIAQEHMISSILRNLLGAIIRLYSRAAPEVTLLFATPSGELHEFGILAAAMIAAGGGLGVAYLGASLPAEEIAEAARKTSAQVVVLGIKGDISRNPASELKRVSENLPDYTELWIGGSAPDEVLTEIKQIKAIYLENFKTLERHLVQLGARF